MTSIALDMSHCCMCPHKCGVNRQQRPLGFCNLDAGLHIAKICLHKGEEPIPGSENGVCNVFFSHCNLRCQYCQNYQISQPPSAIVSEITNIDEAVSQIIGILENKVSFLGFVSPSSHIPHVLAIIEKLHQKNYFPKIIYNTNAYETVETLQCLESVVDIYLPDFKYGTDTLGKELSGVGNYFSVAKNALTEMYRQKKAYISEDNPVLIVRHLVLPNHVANSLDVLQTIADICGNNVFVSLMSQYFPVYKALENTSLNRSLTEIEYNIVLDMLDNLNFERGWTQLLESNDYYQPDFGKENPFES